MLAKNVIIESRLHRGKIFRSIFISKMNISHKAVKTAEYLVHLFQENEEFDLKICYDKTVLRLKCRSNQYDKNLLVAKLCDFNKELFYMHFSSVATGDLCEGFSFQVPNFERLAEIIDFEIESEENHANG